MPLPAALQEAIDLRAATADHPTIELRPYQREARDAVNAAWDAGRNRAMVVLPTGAGKTIVFASVIDYHRERRALVIAHRDELIEQAAEKLRMVDPGAQVGIFKGARREGWAQVVIASIQTLATGDNLDELLAYGRRDLVIVDEAHHAGARTYVETLRGLGCIDGGTWLLGVTATPIASDKQLAGVFPEVVYTYDLADMIDEGFLVPPVGRRIQLGADLSSVRLQRGGGDFVAGDLGRALIDAEAHEIAAHAYAAHAQGRRAIVFVPTVELAELTAESFRKLGISSEAVSGGTKRADRHAIYRRLRTGETLAVTNAMLLTEGFDEPAVDCVMIARPTRSPVLYRQMVGRGLRLAPGKADCLVMDLVGVSGRTSLYGIGTMMGVPDEDLDGRTSLAGRRRTGPASGADWTDHDGLAVEADEVDLVTRWRWVPFDRANGAGGYACDLGPDHGILLLMENASADDEDGDERWTAGVIGPRGHERLTAGLSLEWAQGVAEDHARSLLPGGLPTASASWRRRTAAPGDVAEARAWGSVLDGASRGEVADVVTKGKAEAITRGGRVGSV